MSYELEKNLMNQELYLMGEDAGIEKSKVDMVINMFKYNMELDLIAKYSNLTIKKVKDIINKYKKGNK